MAAVEIIAGDEHMLELDLAADAFEALDPEWQANVPAQIRDTSITLGSTPQRYLCSLTPSWF